MSKKIFLILIIITLFLPFVSTIFGGSEKDLFSGDYYLQRAGDTAVVGRRTAHATLALAYYLIDVRDELREIKIILQETQEEE